MDKSDSYVEIADKFGSIAQQYCAIVDEAGGIDKTELLLRVYRILPGIIAEAMRLPDIQFEDSDEDDDAPVWSSAESVHVKKRSEEWRKLFELLKKEFGEADLYWTIFDPTKIEDPIHGSLADDIADIYGDLKEGLVLLDQKAKPLEEVVWNWRSNFYEHWGRHALSALRTLHELLHDKLTGLEE